VSKDLYDLEDQIQQELGKALGYPWFKDDQRNFPGADEENGVCIGEHVAETLAAEAATRLQGLEHRCQRAEKILLDIASQDDVEMMLDPSWSKRMAKGFLFQQSASREPELPPATKPEIRSIRAGVIALVFGVVAFWCAVIYVALSATGVI